MSVERFGVAHVGIVPLTNTTSGLIPRKMESCTECVLKQKERLWQRETLQQ